MSACSDKNFGPAGGPGCRGGFDFTLLFEEIFFSLVPSVLFLLVAAPRFFHLIVKPKQVQWTLALSLKLLCVLAFGALQLTSLVFWTRTDGTRTRVTFAAATLTFIDSLVLGPLSYAEHVHSVKPATLLNVYLPISALFDAVQIRTLWFIPFNTILAKLLTCALAFKVALTILEALPKRHVLLASTQHLSKEGTSGIYSRITFNWLNPLLRKGFRSILSSDNLLKLEERLYSETLESNLQEAWNASNVVHRYRLLIACSRALKWPLLYAVFPRLCLIAFSFAQPFLISRVVDFLGEPKSEESNNIGYGLIGAGALIYIGIAASTSLYWHAVYRSVVMIRGSIVSMIYKQTLDWKSNDSTESAAMTLMSTDIERIMAGAEDLHEIWANIVQISVATWLLEQKLLWACIVPIIFSIACILATGTMAPRIGVSQQAWVKAVQSRLETTADMLGHMREIKLLGLTDRLTLVIQRLREIEVSKSQNFRQFVVWNITFSQVPSLAAPIVTFSFYVIVAAVDKKASLASAQAFSSLSLILLLVTPLAVLIQAVPSLVAALGCLGRVEDFLVIGPRVDERLHEPEQGHDTPDSTSEKIPPSTIHTIQKAPCGEKTEQDVVVCRAADFGWAAEKPPVLTNVNMNLKKGTLSIIFGPVGCGKTTLVRGLLGENSQKAGYVGLDASRVAYCDQSPWLTNTSIRLNIIGVSNFDNKWYQSVVQACALDRDFEQFHKGDQTLIGSKGDSLSGGQKQRIAIARAVYSKKDILIFDDVMSGLDAATASKVFDRVLGNRGLLFAAKRTRILVTHAHNLLPKADHVILLGPEGRITDQGSFGDVEAKLGENPGTSLLTDVVELVEDDDAVPNNPSVGGEIFSLAQSSTTSLQEIADQTRRTGDWEVYHYYLRTAGWSTSMLFVGFCVVLAFCMNFQTLWLQRWSDANAAGSDRDLGMYMGVYCMLVIIAILAMVLSGWCILVTMTNNSALTLHKIILNVVMNAPLSFFTTVDTGVTTNRFSQDMTLVDMNLPLAGFNAAIMLFSSAVQLIVIAVVANYMAATVPLCLVALYMIQSYYLQTSRQLRMLDLEAKSPLYTNFMETVNGLTTIRAFQWQQDFQRRNHELLDASQQPLYLLYSVQRWLNFVLDMLVAGMVVVLVTLAVELKGKSKGNVSAGGAGVALVTLMNFNQTISILIRFWTSLETSLGAIARIKSFAKVTASEERHLKPRDDLSQWPAHGAIDICHISASYKQDQEPVLKNISLHIKPGERIGICGRTGSGKSTLISSIFQMLPLDHGSISIDGIDLAGVALQMIRSRLNIVTQTPICINGTIRLNLDFSESIPDEEISQALERVGILDLVKEKGGLDAEMRINEWSMGQRQLFCLARAMLKKSTVLVLDEPTSSVDATTDALITSIINTSFQNHTIIAIAHKLQSIRHFDKIVVLEKGEVIEFDSPDTLLAKPSSVFAQLYRESTSSH